MVWLWILIAVAVVLLLAWFVGLRWNVRDPETRMDQFRGQHPMDPDSGWRI